MSYNASNTSLPKTDGSFVTDLLSNTKLIVIVAFLLVAICIYCIFSCPICPEHSISIDGLDQLQKDEYVKFMVADDGGFVITKKIADTDDNKRSIKVNIGKDFNSTFGNIEVVDVDKFTRKANSTMNKHTSDYYNDLSTAMYYCNKRGNECHGITHDTNGYRLGVLNDITKNLPRSLGSTAWRKGGLEIRKIKLV